MIFNAILYFAMPLYKFVAYLPNEY